MISFGEFIKSAREKKELTITEVAEAAGISHSHLSRIENGERNPPKSMTLYKLGKILDITYREMLERAGTFEDLTESEVDEYFDRIIMDERLNTELLKVFSKIFSRFNKMSTDEQKSDFNSKIVDVISKTIMATKAKIKIKISTDLTDPEQGDELRKTLMDAPGAKNNLTFKSTLVENLNKLLDESKNKLTYIPETELVKIPIYGEIRAGYGSLAQEDIVGYEVTSRDSVGDGEYFYLIVKGDSMIDEGIYEGMRVLVRKQNHCQHGKIGVVIVDGEEGTLKRVYYEDDTVLLRASNKRIPPRPYPLDEVMIQGQVTKVEFDV